MKLSSIAKRLRTARGQSLVLIVGAMPVLIGGLALVFDVGGLYYNQLRMQSATDAAVLAGSNYLPAYQSSAISTAKTYAQNNGLKAAEIVSTSVSGDGSSMTMVATRSIPCVFCKVLGVGVAHADSSSSWGDTPGTVTVRSTAKVIGIKSAKGVAPFGIDYRTSLNFGSTVVLKQGMIGPGNWDPLALGGTGASNYQANIENGYPGTINNGDYLNTETGVMNGPTKAGVNYLIAQGMSEYPSGTFNNHALNDPRLVTIPMVDFSNINGSSQVPVKGFALLWLVSVDGSAQITTYFIEQSVANAKGDPGAPSFGASTPILIQ